MGERKVSVIYPIGSFVLALPLLIFGFLSIKSIIRYDLSWLANNPHIGAFTFLVLFAIPIIFFLLTLARYKKSKSPKTIMLIQAAYDAIFFLFVALLSLTPPLPV